MKTVSIFLFFALICASAFGQAAGDIRWTMAANATTGTTLVRTGQPTPNKWSLVMRDPNGIIVPLPLLGKGNMAEVEMGTHFQVVTTSGVPVLLMDATTMPTPTAADARMTTLETVSAGLGSAAFEDTTFFATAAQGALAATALQSVSWTDVSSKPAFATVATSGVYSDLTGKPVLFDGAYSSLAGIPSTFAPSAHNQAWSTITATPTTRAGYGIVDAEASGAAATAQAYAIQRANHTGTQSATTITGLATVATSGAYSDLSGRPSLATVATSGAYSDITGRPSLATVATSGAYADLSGKPTIPTNTNQLTNGSNFVDASGARTAVSLTTTGSGAATYNSTTGVLNVPTPSIPSASTVAVNAPLTNAGTSTAANLSISAATTSTAGTLSAADKTKLDGIATGATANTGTVTSVGLTSSDFAISGSPVTGSGSITANLNTSGVNAGTYSGVTVTAKGIVTGGTTRSFNNTASKTLVTSATGQGGVVLDASRDAAVTYSVSTSTTATIGGASSVTVYLEIATTNSATAGDWTAIQTVSNGQTITLAIVLQSVQTNTLTVSGIVPAGYYVRVRTAVAGTSSATYVNGQEVKL